MQDDHTHIFSSNMRSTREQNCIEGQHIFNWRTKNIWSVYLIPFKIVAETVEIVKSNDVKQYTEKEPAHLQEVELNNRTVEKMSC